MKYYNLGDIEILQQRNHQEGNCSDFMTCKKQDKQKSKTTKIKKINNTDKNNNIDNSDNNNVK